jgi:hypothetical protein
MAKIVISYQDEGVKITHEHNADGTTWPTHVQAMINFLRGIGYVIGSEEDIDVV